MATSRQVGLALLVLLVVFLGFGFTFSVTMPFSTGPDEVAHFQFTRFIAQHGWLPLNWDERTTAGYKSDLPPLFHLMVGLAGRGLDLAAPPFVKVTGDNPRLQLVVGMKNVLGSRALTTEDPYQGEVLLWYLGRWFALLAGAVGVGAAYFLVRAVYPDQPWLALSAAALLAFIPTYITVSSVISYEPLLGALLGLYFVLLFYTLRRPTQNWLYLGLGALLGLAVLAKYTPLPAIPLVPLLVVWLAHRQKWTWRAAGWRLALFSLGLTLTLGSWLLFTEIYFNQVAKLGWVSGLLAPFLASDGSDETSLRVAGFISEGKLGITGSKSTGDAFWVWAWHVFDGLWGGGWFTSLFLGLWVVALAGFIRQGARLQQADQQTPLWLILLAAHLALLTSLPLLRFLITRQAVTGMGQHILFPAGVAMTLLLLQGLSAWLAPTRLTAALLVIAGLCLGQNILTVIRDYDPPLPVQTVPLSEQESVLASFETVSLIGYQHTADSQTLATTLQWRTESLVSEDYRVGLTLLDAHGQPQARWLGQPLNGSYPMRAWLPGDRVRDLINVPVVGLPPGDYQVQLRWFGEAGPVVPVVPGLDKAEGQVSPQLALTGNDNLSLGYISLAPAPTATADTVVLAGQPIGYTLWQQGLPAEGVPTYHENAVITLSTQPRLADEIHLSLVGLDGQPHLPLDHIGHIYSFLVEPNFATGDYRLRFEQWAGTDLVAQAETAPLLRIQTQPRQFQVGPISHSLSANFAGQVALLGYDLPQRRLQPGDNLPITLYWQALKTMGVDLIMFNHLLDNAQQLWGGRDRRAHEVYSTMLWAPGEIVTDSFNLQVDPNAPAGIYHLLVGLYLPVGQAPVSLPLVRDDQLTDSTSVSLGPVKIGPTPLGLTMSTAHPQTPMNQPFGDLPNLILLGYDLEWSAAGGEQSAVLKLTLYWQCESPLPIDYTTFVHVRNAAGEIITQKDQPPLNGAYPTGLWESGEIIADEITIPLPSNPPAGSYQIVIGLYDLLTGQRLAVPGNSANEVHLTDVEIR